MVDTRAVDTGIPLSSAAFFGELLRYAEEIGCPLPLARQKEEEAQARSEDRCMSRYRREFAIAELRKVRHFFLHWRQIHRNNDMPPDSVLWRAKPSGWVSRSRVCCNASVPAQPTRPSPLARLRPGTSIPDSRATSIASGSTIVSLQRLSILSQRGAKLRESRNLIAQRGNFARTIFSSSQFPMGRPNTWRRVR